MNPMMRTLLGELTQVRGIPCQCCQLGWDCLIGPVIQSSAFRRGDPECPQPLEGERRGIDSVQAVLDIPGPGSLFELLCRQSAGPEPSQSVCEVVPCSPQTNKRLRDLTNTLCTTTSLGGSAVPCL